MDRRMQGVLLLAVVLFAAIVLPNLQAKKVTGEAGPGRIPGVPKVGQCLLQTPPAPGNARTPGQSFRLGPCDGVHYGEVAEVVPDTTAGIGDDGFGASCSAESGYIGTPAGVSHTDQISWRPVDFDVINLTPTAVQKAYGQRWMVCVVTPADGTATGYSGLAKGSVSTGRLPAAYAQCRNTITTLADPTVSCTAPHRFEVFGIADLSTAFHDQAQLDRECTTVVRSATQLPDVTAGGTLTVRATPFHWDPNGDPKSGFSNHPADAAAQAVCTLGVTGTRLLASTLIGIGAKPLPWTG